MVNKEKFLSGKTYEEFLKHATGDSDLYNHHYNRAQISEQDSDFIERVSQTNILVISEAYCPDSVVVLPVLQKWVENHAHINLRILLRDENDDIMDHYLTNGARAIPKVVFFDNEFTELGKWGHRPKPIQEYFERFREKIKSGEIDKVDVHKKMRQMYSTDKGKTIIEEMKQILQSSLSQN